MQRITLTLTETEKEALLALAKRERRNPRAQAALLLGDALERLASNTVRTLEIADFPAPATPQREQTRA